MAYWSGKKTAEAIAREVFEHCIWYFLRPGGAPEVTIVDDDQSGQTILEIERLRPGDEPGSVHLPVFNE